MMVMPPDYLPVDPATYWVPLASAVIVGLLSVGASVWVAHRSGTSLERTIRADREAQILEQRLPLYADILVYVAERRQHREVITSFIVVNGMTQLDPFDPKDVFEILGRAHALADGAVLKAFDAADEADMKVQRSVNYRKIAQGDPDMAKRVEQMYAEKEAANDADAELESAVRASLHRDEAPPITRPTIGPEG
jgi:hypothetical protein